MSNSVASDKGNFYQNFTRACIFANMESIDWDLVSSGLSLPADVIQRGRACIRRTVKTYGKVMPWFIGSSQACSPFDIWSDGINMAAYFLPPRPVTMDDEAAVFRGVVACLDFLESKGIALAEVSADLFCQGDELDPCRLSPMCEMVADPSGAILRDNMLKIARLEGFFTSPRVIHALEHVTDMADLAKHPAMWEPRKNCTFLMHFSIMVDTSKLNLDHLIQSTREDGNPSWAVDKVIHADSKNDYNHQSVGGLLRYQGNRIARFHECMQGPLAACFGKTPNGVIDYFDKHVIKGGDLVFAAWQVGNDLGISSLKHFWMKRPAPAANNPK